MKVLSLYFSATAGTETFQRVVQKVCENHDIQFTEIDITDNRVGISEKWLSQFDAYLIGSPITVCSIPVSLQNIIRNSFTNGYNKKVVLYTTSASGRYSTIYGFANLLRSKGYIVSGVVNVKSTNSFYFNDTLHSKQINSKNEVIAEFELQARVIKELLLTSTTLVETKSFNPFLHYYYVLLFIILRIVYFRSYATRNFSVVADKCKGCQKCSTKCPNNNIEIHNNRPTFKNNCITCARCIQCCPQNAIAYKSRNIKQMNHLTIIDFQQDYHF